MAKSIAHNCTCSNKSKEFGLFSLFHCWFFWKLGQSFLKRDNDSKYILCRDMIVFHLGAYLPGLSSGVHFIRIIFLWITFFRIISIMPTCFGFKWIEHLRQDASDHLSFLVNKVKKLSQKLDSFVES